MDNLNMIEDRLPHTNSKHGMCWQPRRHGGGKELRQFTEYELEPFIRVKVGRKYEFVKMADIQKFPNPTVLSVFEGVER